LGQTLGDWFFKHGRAIPDFKSGHKLLFRQGVINGIATPETKTKLRLERLILALALCVFEIMLDVSAITGENL
jgi:hypothetical protein